VRVRRCVRVASVPGRRYLPRNRHREPKLHVRRLRRSEPLRSHDGNVHRQADRPSKAASEIDEPRCVIKRPPPGRRRARLHGRRSGGHRLPEGSLVVGLRLDDPVGGSRLGHRSTRSACGATCTGPTAAAQAGAAPVHGRPVEIATDRGRARGRVVVSATVEDDADGGDRQVRAPSPSHEERGGTTFFRQDECGAKTP
jgi:hypothetical protein